MTTAVDVVDEVRRAIPQDCISTRCRKERCSVPLQGAPSPSVLIDLDHPQAPVGQNDKRCDYIFIGGSGKAWVAPMELKSGKPNASEIVPQLRAGADIAAKIIPENAEVQFLPIAVFGGSMTGIETRRFAARANAVRFRNQPPVKIELHRCGRPLANALRDRR